MHPTVPPIQPQTFAQNVYLYVAGNTDGLKLNGYGCIYANSDSSFAFEDFTAVTVVDGTLFFRTSYPNVIYGHNMRDRSMFGKLSQTCEGDTVIALKGDAEYSYVVSDVLLLDDRYVPNEDWYQTSDVYLSTCEGDGRRVLVCEPMGH